MKTVLLKSLYLLLFVVVATLHSQAQDTLRFQGTSIETGIIAGYNLNLESSQSNKYHLLEVGIIRSKAHYYMHPASASYYFSNELGLNTDNFTWGPKIGGNLSFGFFVLGSEVIYYTNFEENTVRIAPYFGIGAHVFKLTINPHLKIYNKGFPLHSGSFNLTIRPLLIKRKK